MRFPARVTSVTALTLVAGADRRRQHLVSRRLEERKNPAKRPSRTCRTSHVQRERELQHGLLQGRRAVRCHGPQGDDQRGSHQFFVPIGYFMVKRLMRALDGYSARRYQYLAVSLTYLSFLVGMGAPSVIKARSEYASGAATEAETRAAMAGVETPTQEDLEIPAPAATELEPTTSEAEEVDSVAAEEVKAAVSESPDFGPGPGLAFAMFLLLPIVAQLQFGVGLASTAMLSILVALYQAWTRTDGQGMHLRLRGPYRVGHGPIAAR